MKQITRLILSFLLAFFLTVPIQATVVTQTVTLQGVTLTATWNNIGCLGQKTLVTYTLTNTNTTPFDDIFLVNDFIPDATQPGAAGLTISSPTDITPPNPAFVVAFDTTAGPFCVSPPCNVLGPSNGLGRYTASCGTDPVAGTACTGPASLHPLPNNIPITFTVNITTSECGVWSYFPCVTDNVGGACLGAITIFVVPVASVPNFAPLVVLCENGTGFVGTLPQPECPSGTGCAGPFIDCSMLACPTCTGASGTFPTHFIVTNGSGGTVSLLDPTAGIYQFVPQAGFSGTGTFFYNLVSDSIPPSFCSATSPGEVFIPIIQNPMTTPLTISGCAGQGITGNLNNQVTGGVGDYVFSPNGVPTCGQVTIPTDGIFTYTGPTGAGGFICNFRYTVADGIFGCSSSGTVTVNVSPTPVPINQTGATGAAEICINGTLTGQVTGTGGTPPYTFAVVTPPAHAAFFALDPTTGIFTYTPMTGFFGMDGFTFSITDKAGCVTDPDGVVSIFINQPPTTSSGAFTGCENTPFTGNLLPLVTGGTGGAPVFSVTGPAPTCGAVDISPSGIFTFTPNFGTIGTCTFQYAVTQGGCVGTGPDTITVTLLAAPEITGANLNTCQFSNVTGNLNNYVLSSSGTTTFMEVGSPTGGVLSLNPAGPFSFTATIASGVAGFSFEAISNVLPCPSATETVNIFVHPNPTTTTGTINACSGTTKSGTLITLVSGNPPFTFSGPLSETNGVATVNPNGSFTFTPTVGATAGSFSFEVTDTFGCTGVGTENVIVNPNPIATGVTGSVCSNGVLNGTLTGAVSGGSPGYIFTRLGIPVGGMANVSTNGTFTFVPTAGATAGSFVYEATDTKGCIGTGPVAITINLGPSASSGLFTGCSYGIDGNLATLVSGANPPFTFSGPIGPVFNGSVVVSPTGPFVFTPSTGVLSGQGSFNYIVTDSSFPPCTSNPEPVTVIIEQGPVAGPATYNTCENVPLTVSSASGLANFVTGGMPPYMFFETGGTPACAASLTVNTDGSFAYTPALNFTGLCNFLWFATDSTPCNSNISTGTINVHPSPVASNVGPLAACEFDPSTGDLNAFMSVGTPPYSFTGDSPINGMINYLLPTGPFSFTPASTGLASFTYSAIDSFGCMSNTGTVSFDAAESPVITSPSPLNVCQNSSVTSTATATGSAGIQPFNFTITGVVNGTAVITATTPTSATFTFTPTVTVFPTPTVMGSVTIRATAGMPSTCYSEVTVIVNIHQNPVITVTGIGSCTGNFTGNLQPFVTGGMPPYIFAPAVPPTTPPGCGTVGLDIFGNFTFMSPPGFTGPCAFTFTVTDQVPCTSTGTITVSVNQPPVANNATLCACPNTPVTGNLNGFVSAGTGKPPFTFAIIGTPIGGKVFLNPKTGLFTFLPNPGFNGFASFQYQVTDSNNPPCVSNIGTITIQVPCCPTVM